MKFSRKFKSDGTQTWKFLFEFWCCTFTDSIYSFFSPWNRIKWWAQFRKFQNVEIAKMWKSTKKLQNHDFAILIWAKIEDIVKMFFMQYKCDKFCSFRNAHVLHARSLFKKRNFGVQTLREFLVQVYRARSEARSTKWRARSTHSF